MFAAQFEIKFTSTEPKEGTMLILFMKLLSTAFLVNSAPQLSKRRVLIGALRDDVPTFHSTIPVRRRRNTKATVAASVSRKNSESSLHFLVPRGGAVEKLSRDLSNDADDNAFLQRVRNVIRWVLKLTKGSSFIHKGSLVLFKALESATGLRLLPEEKKKKKSGKKRKHIISNLSDAPLVESKVLKVKPKSATKNKKKQHALKHASKASATTNLQLKNKLTATNPNYRIQQELKAFLQEPPEHLSVATGKNIRIWIVTVEGIGVYKDETFRLRIQFPNNYPTVPPSVYFLPPNIPVHEHVYTNGDICLSLLGKDWRPTLTAQSVAHSILSILASATSKSLPMDNARHSQKKPGQYQADWVYHDDNC